MKPAEPIPTLPPDGFVRRFFEPSVHEAVTLYPGPAASAPQTLRWGIHRVEDVVAHLRFPIPPLRNRHYELLFLKTGHAGRTDGLNRYAIEPGTVYLSAPGQIVSSEFCSPDATGFYCFFYGDVVLTTFQNSRFLDDLPFFQPAAVPLVTLPEPIRPAFDGLLAQLETEFLAPETAQPALTSALLQAVLLHLSRLAPAPTAAPTTAAAELTARFKDAVARRVLLTRAVRDYADQLAVTPNHLNRCVKETTGRTASDWIADMVLLEAKVRLRQTTRSVSEIAGELGFDDASYFGRVFRRKTGLTPLDYRQRA